MIASFDFDVVTGPSLQRREDVPADAGAAAAPPHQPAVSPERKDAHFPAEAERR